MKKLLPLLFLLLTYPAFALGAAHKTISDISANEIAQLIKKSPDTLLVDVRTRSEILQLGTIGLYQNINIPRGWLEFRIADNTPSFYTPIVVYCGTNVRSPAAAITLMDMSYTNVGNYSGGYFDWQEKGFDVFKGTLDSSSLLYQRPQKVVDGVYSAIGALQPSTYEDSDHNNNLSFIVADYAVVVFNGGGSYLLTKAMHEEIKKATDLPVKYLIYKNAQGHAVFGGNYWKEQGVEIIAHENMPKILQHSSQGMLTRTQSNLKDKCFKSNLIMPDRTFKDQYIIPVKGKKIVLKHFGNAHSPDDIQLWLPEDSLLISGDFAFNERLLPILGHTNIREWIGNWDKLVALNPQIIMPGHGGVTDLDTVTYYAKDYLSYMLEQVEMVLEEDGELTNAYNIDQSEFIQWKTYRQLVLRNAATIFKMLEFE